MPAFGRDQILQPAQVDDLTEYVVALSGRRPTPPPWPAPRPVYAEQCASLPRPGRARAMSSRARPISRTRDWLYGSDRADIRDQIWNGRGGVMPAWGQAASALKPSRPSRSTSTPTLAVSRAYP
jgi:cytochrome c oxidase cbb3-type subunit 3